MKSCLKRIWKRLEGLFSTQIQDFEPTWFMLAQEELGVKEAPGTEDNPRIRDYHEAAVGAELADAIPWCSSFVNWCFREVGLRGSGSALARSWLQWGNKLDKPKKGCVVVLSRGTKKWQGHVGFFVSESENYIQILGGNQRDEVSIASFPKSRVLDYRWPHSFMLKN